MPSRPVLVYKSSVLPNAVERVYKADPRPQPKPKQSSREGTVCEQTRRNLSGRWQ